MMNLRCVRALSIEQFEVSRWHGVGNLRPMGLQSFGYGGGVDRKTSVWGDGTLEKTPLRKDGVGPERVFG